ncbi:MAG TPA: DUF2019 domain-containing protein [Stellaceae bacterium]|nr:DUF2019 domain-containing protein [Stellaceae bacterium]
MKRTILTDKTVDELINGFAEICVAQDHAIWFEGNTKYKSLFKQMMAIDAELKRRGLDARQAMTRLFTHPNIQVRLKAAINAFDIAPESARTVLEDIRRSKHYPQAADAGLRLDVEDGKF